MNLYNEGKAVARSKAIGVKHLAWISPLVLGACSSIPLPIADPEQEISVGTALSDIGTGFAALKRSLRGEDMVLGLYPCRIEISLNVKAGRKQSGGLVVGTGPEFEAILKLAGEYSEEVVAERGNTIEIEMYNPACLPPDTLGYEKPEMVDKVMDGMDVGGEGPPISRTSMYQQESPIEQTVAGPESQHEESDDGETPTGIPPNIVRDNVKPTPQKEYASDHPKPHPA